VAEKVGENQIIPEELLPSEKPEKNCWHLMALQQLHPERFARVVGKILKKEYLCIK
jgi:hypothetical protein